MKTIIAGGRDFVGKAEHNTYLDVIAAKLGITEVVSGKAPGADKYGEDWAKRSNLPVKEFPADWAKYGRAAGPIRNGQMAEYADALIALPGGKGTANMISQAVKRGLTVYVYPDTDAY